MYCTDHITYVLACCTLRKQCPAKHHVAPDCEISAGIPTPGQHIHIYIQIQGGFRRGVLTPALAPRMPVIVTRMYAKRGRICDTVLPRGTIKNISRLNEDEENTGIRFNEPATNLAIRHTMTNRSSTAAAATIAVCRHTEQQQQQQRQQQHSVRV